MVKFLITSFNSLGEILLTTPIIRGLKQQVKGCEVHYITLTENKDALANNPYLDKVFYFEHKLKETIETLSTENYDYIIDLNEDYRSNQLMQKLPIVSFAYDKQRFKEWLLVNLKINKLTKRHLVDRYMDTLNVFDVEDDRAGLDFYIPEKEEVIAKDLHSAFEGKFMAVVLSAAFNTRTIPIETLASIINLSGVPVCLIGNKKDIKQAKSLEQKLKVPFLNTIDKLTFIKAASLMNQSTVVLTPESDYMHLATALNKPILSLWGNTVSDFGKTPYLPHEQSVQFEVNSLRCRPCTRKGYEKCPKGHFKCMTKIDHLAIVEKITERIKA